MGSFSIWHRLIVALVLTPGLLYVRALQRAFQAIGAELRPMAPGMVWLLLIPLVNSVFMFFVVTHLKNGCVKMGTADRLTYPTDGGYGIGRPLAILIAASVIPAVGAMASIPVLVAWQVWMVLHWTGKMPRCRKQVKVA